MRHFKAVTGSHKRAGLLVHFFAEFVGRNVQIIINQCRSAGFRLYIADVRFAADPIVQNLQILPDDLSAAFQQLIAVLQRSCCQHFIEYTAAHKIIIPMRKAALYNAHIVCCNPAKPKTGQRKNL